LIDHLVNEDSGLLITASRTPGHTGPREDLMAIAESLLLLVKLVPLKINAEAVEGMICRIAEFIREAETAATNPCLLQAWKKAGLLLHDRAWAAEASSRIGRQATTPSAGYTSGQNIANIRDWIRVYSSSNQNKHCYYCNLNIHLCSPLKKNAGNRTSSVNTWTWWRSRTPH
jgi:hypothetical protein